MPQDFTHLHVHTDASLLDGANPLDELIGRAKDLGMKSLAVTDHGVMYNLWKFQEKAQKAGIKPILGMEAYVAPGARDDKTVKTPMEKWFYHLVLLAQNEQGYKNLMKLSSLGFKEGFYYKPRLDREIIERYSEGLIVTSACLAGEVAQNIEAGRIAAAAGQSEAADKFAKQGRETIEWYKRVFGERYFLEVQAHKSQGQAELNKSIFELGKENNIKVIATTDAHFLTKDAHAAHDCLICIEMNKSIDDPDRMRYDEGLYFQSGDEVGGFFEGRMDMLDNTMEIADRVNVGFSKRYHVPSFVVADDEAKRLDQKVVKRGGVSEVLSPKVRSDSTLSTDDLAQRAREVELLRELAEEGARVRFGQELSAEVRERLEYELKVISDSGYAGYHLIVADFIRQARSEDIPVGPGRGSAAGSLVCYALGITNVDPLKYDLLFERFLNPDRISMPDIDVDFCQEGRGRVIDYVKDKYGHEAVCQIITFGTMKSRSAIKDVGRVLGFSPAETNEFAQLIPNEPNYSLTIAEAITKVPGVRDRYKNDTRWKKLCDLAIKLEGLHRHAGVHAAGVVIAPGPVDDYVPVSRAKDAGFVSQYDMNDLEHAGMLKMDFLGLTTLTVIDDAVKNIQAMDGGTKMDLDKLPLDDAATYKMLADGQVAGVFQFESNLAKEKLTAMRPDRLEDLIATNALLRPGPLDSGQADLFIKRKRGEDPVSYPHPLLEDILKNTYGVITYQEQVMRAVQVLGGYTLAQADILRKAVGKKDDELIKSELANFADKAVALGTCTREQAKDVAALIYTFGRYGFNRSHSVAYSILGYQTAYLKRHYPEAFMGALLSSVMSDKDKTAKYLGESQEMGISVLAPSVNESGVKYTAVKQADGTKIVRFGLTAIKGVGESMVNAILAARASGPFVDFFDFSHRVHQTGKLTSKVLTALIDAGACDGLGPSRAAMLAVVEPLKKESDKIKKQRDRYLKQKAEQEALGEDEENGLFGKQAKKTKKLEAPQDSAVQVPYPNVPELELGELLTREKDAIGLYVSGFPLDPYKEQAAALATHTANQLTTYQSGKVRIVGVVTSVEEKTVKKSGNQMAKLSIEDLTGTVGVVAFSREWSNFNYLLKPGALVVIEGKFSESDSALERTGDLQMERAQGLMDALSAGDVAVAISLSPALKADAGSMERIKQILAEHEGNAQVLIEEPPNKVREAKSKVRPMPELVEQLRAVVGQDMVHVRRGVSAYDTKSQQYSKNRR